MWCDVQLWVLFLTTYTHTPGMYYAFVLGYFLIYFIVWFGIRTSRAMGLYSWKLLQYFNIVSGKERVNTVLLIIQKWANQVTCYIEQRNHSAVFAPTYSSATPIGDEDVIPCCSPRTWPGWKHHCQGLSLCWQVNAFNTEIIYKCLFT